MGVDSLSVFFFSLRPPGAHSVKGRCFENYAGESQAEGLGVALNRVSIFNNVETLRITQLWGDLE